MAEARHDDPRTLQRSGGTDQHSKDLRVPSRTLTALPRQICRSVWPRRCVIGQSVRVQEGSGGERGPLRDGGASVANYSADSFAKLRVLVMLATPFVALVGGGIVLFMRFHALPLMTLFIAGWFALVLWPIRARDAFWKTAWTVTVTDDDVLHARSWPLPHQWDIPIGTITLITAPGSARGPRPFYEIAHSDARLRVTPRAGRHGPAGPPAPRPQPRH